MSPQNLEDVEEYLVKRADIGTATIDTTQLREWVRNIFAELRLREASVLQGPQEKHPE